MERLRSLCVPWNVSEHAGVTTGCQHEGRNIDASAFEPLTPHALVRHTRPLTIPATDLITRDQHSYYGSFFSVGVSLQRCQL
jgi:hypothetical protein